MSVERVICMDDDLHRQIAATAQSRGVTENVVMVEVLRDHYRSGEDRLAAVRTGPGGRLTEEAGFRT
jgi:hypothetical protein